MKQSKGNKIYLNDWRTNGSKVFSGRDRGKLVREQSNIDQIASDYDSVEIIVPDNLFSINPSFLEELFVNVVSKFGKDEFYKKFKFNSEGRYDIHQPLSSAINRILRNYTAIG